MIINFANETTTIIMNTLAANDWQIKQALLRAQEIEILIDYLKSHPQGASTRELENYLAEKLHESNVLRHSYNDIVRANTLLNWFENYGWVTSEVRAEEKHTVKFDEYLGRNDKISFNNDDTITIYFSYATTPKTIRDYHICKVNGKINVEGVYDVQVKRKYWIWRKA